MPLPKGQSRGAVEARFHDFRHGKTYAKTERDHGKGTATKQLEAVALRGTPRKGGGHRKNDGTDGLPTGKGWGPPAGTPVKKPRASNDLNWRSF
jgi:hypothetical protein